MLGLQLLEFGEQGQQFAVVGLQLALGLVLVPGGRGGVVFEHPDEVGHALEFAGREVLEPGQVGGQVGQLGSLVVEGVGQLELLAFELVLEPEFEVPPVGQLQEFPLLGLEQALELARAGALFLRLLAQLARRLLQLYHLVVLVLLQPQQLHPQLLLLLAHLPQRQRRPPSLRLRERLRLLQLFAGLL